MRPGGRRPAGTAPAISAARRAALRRRLLAWYDAARRDLPWRAPQGQADPYRAWLAEVMLQQTRVEAALPYYRRFLEAFPTLPALAAAREEDVLARWAGLGYYARGRNLLAAARIALARHGGLPRTVAALRALPGFGPYTAGAVASIAFGVAAPAVDGNAARVLSRLFRVEGRPEASGVRRRIGALAALLVPEGRPGDWNQALMELGATLCGRSPACARCPVAPLCEARRAGRERRIPPPRRRPAAARLRIACGVLWRDGEVLLVRRASRGLLGGLWELPGVPLSGEEEPRAALKRTLRAEWGVRAAVGGELAAVERALTHRKLQLIAYEVQPLAAVPDVAAAVPGTAGKAAGAAVKAVAEAVPGTGRAGTPPLRWAAPGEIEGLAISTAMRRLLEAVTAGRKIE